MEIQYLPPHDNPKPLSARQAPQSLYEQMLAFLCANNQEGFMDDSGVVADYTKFAKRPDNEDFSIDAIRSIDEATVAGLMTMIAMQDKIVYKDVLQFGYKIKEVSGKKIKLNKAQILVARLLGYYNHDALYKSLITKYQLREIPKEHRDRYYVDNRRDRTGIFIKFPEPLPQNNHLNSNKNNQQ